MGEIRSFDLSICRLLQEYPLYDYRTPKGETFDLSVLLIGRGAHMDTLRSKILSNGQLLDTALAVTAVSENTLEEADKLQKAAPDLKRFISIQGETAEWDCGSLRFETEAMDDLQAVLEKYRHFKYVLISLETRDEAPVFVTSVPGQVVAWVAGDSITVCGPERKTFFPERDDKAVGELLDVAYRLHYAYEKGNDPYITNREIRENFNDPERYNYQSNIECALHVRSKIKCAGIDPTATNSAAEAFARKMAEDPRLLGRLAQLEHRRWCVSKAAGGRRKPENVHVIYGDDGSTTHSDEWHVALVPYTELDRHLMDHDWIADAPDTIDGLDELDKQTLRVHRQCARISKGKLEKAQKEVSNLKKALPEGLGHYADLIDETLKEMLDGKQHALFLYRSHIRKLEMALGKEKSDATLKTLKQLMGAPIEYLTRKDYKKQNLVLVGSIPFALCGWKSTVLVKLMADSVQDCVAAAWQLEPGQLIFVDTAQTLEDLKHLHRKAQQVEWFLSRNCEQVKPSYRIFVPRNAVFIQGRDEENKPDQLRLHDLLRCEPGFFGNGDWKLIEVDSLEPEVLRPRFVDLMNKLGTTSIDLTGGKPSLIALANGYARYSQAGAFFVQGNRIYNCSGARGMEMQALDKGLSVQQLFDQAGARRIKQDDENISDTFFAQCETLWKIAHRHTEYWHYFCVSVSRAYADPGAASGTGVSLGIQKAALEDHFGDSFRIGGSSRVLKAQFEPILQDLLDSGLVEYVAGEDCYQISCEEVLACLRNSGKVLEYYIYCSARKSGCFEDVVMSWMFRHAEGAGAAKNEVDVICTGKTCNLFISAKNVSLNSLKQNGFLNYVCYEVGWLADRFGGSSHRTVLAAPNVPQFEGDKLSRQAAHAMSRGVYLLGDRCFEPGKLEEVLKRIVNGRENWCTFLVEGPITTA